MRFFKDTYGIRKREIRPHGRLPDKSQLNEMLDSANEYVKLLSEYTEVIGITLGGGLSRGYGDRLSEIDLNIYLDEEGLTRWGLGKSPIPQGDHMGHKYHMDVSFLNIEKERESKRHNFKSSQRVFVESLVLIIILVVSLTESRV